MNASVLALVLAVLAAPAIETAKEPGTHLYVRTIPPGAKIILDQQPGTTDGLLSVTPGKHRIVVELDGYAPERRDVDVPQGRITRVEMTLKPTNDSYDGRSMAEWKRLALNDVSADTRAKAMDALAALGIRRRGLDTDAVAAIKAALAKETSRTVLRTGYRALDRLGPPALPVLLEGMKNPQARTRAIVARALPSYVATIDPTSPSWEVLPEQVVAAIIEATHDADPGVRAAACVALGDLRLTANKKKHADKVVPALIKALADEERAMVETSTAQGTVPNSPTTVRIEACRALGIYRVKADVVVPALIGVIERKTPEQATADDLWLANYTKVAAVESLGRMGPAAVAALPAMQAMQKERWFAHDPRVRSVIMRIGGPNAMGGLGSGDTEPPAAAQPAPEKAVAAAKPGAAGTLDVKMIAKPDTAITGVNAARIASAAVGDKVLIEIRVTNKGSQPLTNVKVTVRLGGPALMATIATEGYRKEPTGVSWTLATLAPGGSQQFGIVCHCLEPAAHAALRAVVTSQQGIEGGDSLSLSIHAIPVPQKAGAPK